MTNPIILNIYRFLDNGFRLTFLAICCVFFLNLASCKNSLQNQPFVSKTEIAPTESAINLNTATVAELEKLPRIGNGIAKRIVEHRENFGKYRRAEQIILVKGMSDKKFREIRDLVKVE